MIVCATQTIFSDESDNYKIVEFSNGNGCLLQANYNNGNIINGCMGIDGAYLYDDGEAVYFMQAGTVGVIDIDNVKIKDAKDYLNKLSSYRNINGTLYHNIKTDLDSDYYTYSLAIDTAPDYLKEKTIYYSYDGHYFYDSFYKMIDDYRNDVRDNAVNKTPYYNYYQYLPFRSMSNYTYKEIQDYISNTLHINAPLDKYFDNNDDGANDYVNKSQLYDNIDSFFVSEEAYGVNAMLLLSISMEESSFGKTLNSYLTNNLFQNAAFSSLEETENKKYSLIENSVYSYAKHYIVDRYTNPLKISYNGAFLGNKESGMNKSYSNDPYWAEKVASNYYLMDSYLGFKDKDSLTVGIFNNPTIYKDKDLKNKLYTNENNNVSFVILEDTGNSYKVQLEKNNDTSYSYDFMSNVAYVKKDNAVLIGSKDIQEREYQSYEYDFEEGTLDKENKFKLSTFKELVEPSLYKEKSDFVGYKDGVPSFKEITTISLTSGFKDEVEVDSYPDLTNAKITVHYKDGSYAHKQITSEMIQGFDTSKDGESEFVISYKGVTTQAKVKVNQWLKLVKSDVKTIIENTCSERNDISSEDLTYVKRNIKGINLEFDDIRYMDYLSLKNNNYPIYFIENNNLDLSFSGLSLALSNDKKKGNYQLYDDTFYVKAKDISKINLSYLEEVAKGYGFEIVGSTNISFRYNLIKVEPKTGLIAQVNIDNKDNSKYYSVYHVDSKGNIVKLKTTQTNSYIQFSVSESGDYVFLSRPSANIYNFEDNQENISYLNNGVDSFSIMLQILIYLVLMLYNFVCVVIYYMLVDYREKRWNDYRKSLRLAVFVQEEKQKN